MYMPDLMLYNTMSRKKEVFTPLSGEVGLYTCGPTVYDYQHIGNYRTFIFEDVLKRVLLLHGWRVNHVMNITDVGHLVSDADEGEDKMMKGARREGKTAWEIAQMYTEAFEEDLVKLNIMRPTQLVKATDHIPEQIELVRQLEAKGVTYRTSDGIYIDTSRVKEYGKLVRLDGAGLRAGARVEMSAEKKHPTDFAVWKFSPAGAKRDMEWESPWGKGFPGWHLECSAMSMKYLGETFDIHCGGIDHAPVHHTNEIAQSETVTGQPLARWWCHGEFLQMGEHKMAKSSGGFITLRNLAERGIDPLAYRYFTYSAHYRSKLAFSWEALQAAQHTYERLLELAADWGTPKGSVPGVEEKFFAAVHDDLNMPVGIATVWELAKGEYAPAAKLGTLIRLDGILGLGIQRKVTQIQQERKVVPAEIQTQLHAREIARAEKRYAEADVLRDEIKQAGWKIMDTPEGQRLRKG